MVMNDMGRTLIIIGLVITVAGVLVSVLRPEGLPRLPGDIYLKKDGLIFYFPLGWCILISAVLSLILWLSGK